MTIDCLLEHKDNINELAEQLLLEDIAILMGLLGEKNNEIRYAAFLALQQRSKNYSDVYPYWDTFSERLKSDNSYQRSIGIMMMAENVRWDKDGRFDRAFDGYMAHCSDEKFITSRQTIQGIRRWLEYKPELFEKIISKLSAIQIEPLASTQRKLILIDIIDVFLDIQKIKPYDEITDYVMKALSGGLLDKKAAKSIQEKIQI